MVQAARLKAAVMRLLHMAVPCVHDWDVLDSKPVMRTPSVGRMVNSERCRRCVAERTVTGGGYVNPSKEARELLYARCEAAGMERPVYGSSCGSGWLVELPTAISILLEQGKRVEALALADRCIVDHSSEASHRIVWSLQETA